MTAARSSSLAGLLACAVLAGCGQRDDRPLRVVAIGEGMRIVDPSERPFRPADAVLMGAVAQGLVRTDAAARIVPGLAIRWNVSDDGLSYIFRIGEARWPDGSRVTPRYIVHQLRDAIARRSRNPLAGVMTGIEEILATNDVIEIRLAAPRPNLLAFLAQPDLAIVRSNQGSGPFRVAADADGLVLARSIADGEDVVEHRIRLGAARSALAVVRFGSGAADVVLGGTFDDLPIVRAADPARGALRFDPADGLFGLAVVDIRGPLARPELRRALSMAIDREAVVASLAVPGLLPRATLTASGLSGLAAPALPGWSPFRLATRRAEARRLVRLTVPEGATTRPRVRVALPDGPGSRLLFAHLARDWAAIGVEAVRVGLTRSADLRLVDEVAPSDGASWYLERFTCARAAVCDPAADAALASARGAPDASARAAFHAQADRRLLDADTFLPLATPVRWSLVSRRAPAFRTNALAVHSLADLSGE